MGVEGSELISLMISVGMTRIIMNKEFREFSARSNVRFLVFNGGS